MNFTVNNKEVSWDGVGSTKAVCYAFGDRSFIANYHTGDVLFHLTGNYPHFINDVECADFQAFLKEWVDAGGLLPPNYEDVTQFLKLIEDDVYIDEVGVRDGERFTGIYATGISELNFTDLTGRSIVEFHGTASPSIVGNSVILDPLLTFSSLVFDDGTLFSIESLCGSIIVGSQTCTVVGTPNIQESIAYKSWRNLLGYNLAECGYNVVTIRKEISPTESIERIFLNTEIALNEDTTFLGIYDGYVPKRWDLSGNNHHPVQPVASLQPEWDDINKEMVFDAIDDGLVSGITDLSGDFTIYINGYSPNSTITRYLIAKYDINSNRQVAIGTSNGFWIALYSPTGGSAYTINSTKDCTSLSDAVITYDGSDICLYVNGTLDTCIAGSVFNGDSKVTLGCFLSSGAIAGSRGCNIKSAKIYRRTLSPGEVLDLHNDNSVDATNLILDI